MRAMLPCLLWWSLTGCLPDAPVPAVPTPNCGLCLPDTYCLLHEPLDEPPYKTCAWLPEVCEGEVGCGSNVCRAQLHAGCDPGFEASLCSEEGLVCVPVPLDTTGTPE